MKNLIRLILLSALLLSSQAQADSDSLSNAVQTAGCMTVVLCAAQTGTGDCTALPASGEERVFNARGFSRATFTGIQSVGDYTCNVIGSDQGHDDSSGEGQQINTTAIDQTAQILTLDGLFGFVWLNCPTIATSATITAQFCAGR